MNMEYTSGGHEATTRYIGLSSILLIVWGIFLVPKLFHIFSSNAYSAFDEIPSFIDRWRYGTATDYFFESSIKWMIMTGYVLNLMEGIFTIQLFQRPTLVFQNMVGILIALNIVFALVASKDPSQHLGDMIMAVVLFYPAYFLLRLVRKDIEASA